MRARHGKDPAITQHVFRQPLRPGTIGKIAIEDFLHQRRTATDDITDNKNICTDISLFRSEALNQLNAHVFQLGTHRWINVGIAPGHLVAGFTRQCGNAAHKGATDAENVNMHKINGAK
jgi:hypothetical protein